MYWFPSFSSTFPAYKLKKIVKNTQIRFIDQKYFFHSMLPTPDIKITDPEKVYDPAEDSFLLLDLFEELRDYFKRKEFGHKTPLVVEIGTGSGIVSTFINEYVLPNGYFIATDINPYSCASALQTNKANTTSFNLDAVRCDLLSAIQDHLIDVLVFNPPYVPTESIPSMPTTKNEEYKWMDIALNGGPTGMDITNKVLDSLNRKLSVNGEAYILFCARNKPKQVAANFQSNHDNFKVEQVIFRKAGWEELSIYRFLKVGGTKSTPSA